MDGFEEYIYKKVYLSFRSSEIPSVKMSFPIKTFLVFVLCFGWLGFLFCLHRETERMDRVTENLEILVDEGVHVGRVSQFIMSLSGILPFVRENPNAVKIKKEIPEDQPRDWSCRYLGCTPFIKEYLEAQRRLSDGESALRDLRNKREEYLSSWYGWLDQQISHPKDIGGEEEHGERETNLIRELLIISFCQQCALLFLTFKVTRELTDNSVNLNDDDKEEEYKDNEENNIGEESKLLDTNETEKQ